MFQGWRGTLARFLCRIRFPSGPLKFEHHETAGRTITNELREERKKLIGSRLDRKLKKYSPSFNEIFNFFLKSYRKGLLTFCGSDLNAEYKITFDVNGKEGKFIVRSYENGNFSNMSSIVDIPTRHPNIVKGVITGKKSWGLHVNMWIEGVVEGTLSIQEIIEHFENHGIIIPESFVKDFRNRVYSKIANSKSFL